MKKILLATTILGLSAGYAAADISWSASAAAGFASAAEGVHKSGAFDSNGEVNTYSSIKIGVKGSAETDSGLTFSASTDMTKGQKFNTGDDLGDGFETKDGSFAEPTISVGGAFGTISFSSDNFDFYDDSEGNGDVKFEGTFGAITAGVISDVDGEEYSVKLGYSADGIAVNLDTDSYETTNASAAYTMGAITATLSTNHEGGDQVSKLKLAYSADAISASIKVGDDDSYDLVLGYTANGLAVTAETDDTEYTKVTGSYDLGGGLSLQAGADSDESAYVGAAMKF